MMNWTVEEDHDFILEFVGRRFGGCFYEGFCLGICSREVASESSSWLVGCILFVFDIEHPRHMTALDGMIVGGMDCCCDDTQRIAPDELV
jgi:hypothetical protein